MKEHQVVMVFREGAVVLFSDKTLMFRDVRLLDGRGSFSVLGVKKPESGLKDVLVKFEVANVVSEDGF